MECIEARALKSSFLRELAMKSTQQAFFEDLWCVNAFNGVPCEDFSVDTFLDLSGKEFEDGFVGESEEEEEKDSVSISSQDRVNDENSNSSGASDSGFFPAGELSYPVDDMEDLEWLSQFVDDSVSEFSLLCPAGSFKENTGEVEESRSEPGTEPALHRPPSPCFPVAVPAKARSKRCRPNGRVWSVVSPPLSESASSLSSSSSSSSTPCLFPASPVHDVEIFTSVGKPPAKKQKRNTAAEAGGVPQTQRRCTHCQVQKTPQWRAGPLGPKTLCNACGVRYKSGRLFPEYRPACSPTFSGDVHSNSHRKVLEMRRIKETSDTESGLTSMAPSV